MVTGPRMTIPTPLVLDTLLADPAREPYGSEIREQSAPRSGTVHPVLARLEGVGWLRSRREGFVSQAFALRAAPGASRSPTEESAVQQTTSLGRRILCHTLRHHDWHTYSTEDGERYASCTVCHRDRTESLGRGAHFGAFAGGNLSGAG